MPRPAAYALVFCLAIEIAWLAALVALVRAVV
jgi:hypothetical protein